MPLIDVAAQDYFLDAMWATAPGALLEVGLLTGDPRVGGVELTSEGAYERVAVVVYDGFWMASIDGLKRSELIAFPDTTGPWPTAATWEGIWVDGVLWDAGPLTDPVVVTEAGPGVQVRLSRHFNSAL